MVVCGKHVRLGGHVRRRGRPDQQLSSLLLQPVHVHEPQLVVVPLRRIHDRLLCHLASLLFDDGSVSRQHICALGHREHLVRLDHI